MTLYFIGLGLNDEKDISLKSLEIVKKCDVVYREKYTGKLNASKEAMEKLYGKKIIYADRELVENEADDTILKQAKDKNVAFLVVGDPMAATTHVDLRLRAHNLGIKTYVFSNASVISAIGQTGLQVYKFGKTISIPYPNNGQVLDSVYDGLMENLKNGLHTLFLLDIKTESRKYMNIKDAINVLLDLEKKKKKKIFNENTLCIGCARLSSVDQIIKVGSAKKLLKVNFGSPVHCLIVPGKMHFLEEEALEMWK